MAYPNNPYLSNVCTPYHYQWLGIQRLLKTPYAILGDETGLGKTIQAVYTYTFFKNKYPAVPCIVFVEKSTVYQWEEEFKKFTQDLDIEVITATTHKNVDKRVAAFRNSKADVIITTYSITRVRGTKDPATNKLQKITPANNPILMAIRYKCQDEGFFIYDEPNVFKNVSTQVHQNIRYLQRYACKIIGLTAMVFENCLEEAYGVVKNISTDTFRTKDLFYQQYCIYWMPNSHTKVVTGYKNLDHFKRAMSPIHIRRTYDDPLVQQAIPETRDFIRRVYLDASHSSLVADAMDNFITTSTGEQIELSDLTSLVFQQRLVNDPRFVDDSLEPTKLLQVFEFVEGDLANDRVIVFSRFKETINALHEIFRQNLSVKRLKSVARITGDESAEVRKRSQDMYNKITNGIILMTTAGVKGLNLQAGRILVLVDSPWGYGTDHQLLGRIKRTGSTYSHVLRYRFLATLASGRETIDHKVWETLQDKKGLFDQVSEMDEQDFSKSLYRKMKNA